MVATGNVQNCTFGPAVPWDSLSALDYRDRYRARDAPEWCLLSKAALAFKDMPDSYAEHGSRIECSSGCMASLQRHLGVRAIPPQNKLLALETPKHSCGEVQHNLPSCGLPLQSN